MAGGGTGGHVIPALAVARELRSRGHEVIFVGTERGLEAQAGAGGGVRAGDDRDRRTESRGPAPDARDAWPPARSPRCSSDRCVREAAAVFSMGGYVAGPPVHGGASAADSGGGDGAERGAGFTNRRSRAWSSRALVTFPETARFFPQRPHRVTGLPVREEFFRIPPKPRGDVLHRADHRRQPGIAHAEPGGASRAGRCSARPASRCGSCIRPAPAGFDEIRDGLRQLRARGRSGALHRRHAGGVCRGRPGGLPRRARAPCRELAAAGKPSILVPVSLCRRRSPDAQRGGDGARRRRAPGARCRDDRRETVRNCEPKLIGGPGARWAKRRGSSPSPARRGARRNSRGGRARLTATFSIDSCTDKPKQYDKEMFFRPQHLHFTGIGGIGMSGIAEVLLNLGYQISRLAT